MEQRYRRQIMHTPFGEAGQKKLGSADIAVVGAGALGSVMLSLLARAGAGKLRVIDDDRVTLENLHRQFLYSEKDAAASRLKTEAAAERLQAVNSSVQLQVFSCRAVPDNAQQLLGGADIVLDATDSFASRDTINTAAFRLGIPWIYSGVTGSQGVVCPLFPGNSACFRCFLPELPEAGVLPDMESSGVIGPIVASTAAEAVSCVMRYFTEGLCFGEMFYHDVWHRTRHCVHIERIDYCPVCGMK